MSQPGDHRLPRASYHLNTQKKKKMLQNLTSSTCIELIYSKNVLYSVINKLFQYTNTDNTTLHGDYVVKFVAK
jgi:ribosomal protein L25 (general stress protein Ctc)